PALILLGVLSARWSGRPRWIDMSQRELVTAMLLEEILRCSVGAPDPVPRANNGPAGVEWAIPCEGADDWVAVSVITSAHRQAIARVIGRPVLASVSDGDLATAVEKWSRGRSKGAVMDALQAAGVPAAAVTKGYELHSDPFFQLIDFFKRVPLPDHGDELQRGWIVRFDDEPGGQVRSRAPHVGEHTVQILQSLLGYRQPDIERLLDAEVIAQSGWRPGAGGHDGPIDLRS
ncbi:MAG: CoA transferase, partial [Solirubrobacterales bacterium]|nr:CoA transferase [Solirubrobacterales bacterium]